MAVVNLKKAAVNASDPVESVKQLETTINLLVDRLEYVLTHLDANNMTTAFLTQIGGTTNGNNGTSG